MYAAEGARYFHDMLAELFEAEGVAPIAIQSLSQIHSMLALVRAGIGAALVPEAAQSLHFDDVHVPPRGDRSAAAGGALCRLAQRQ